MYVCVYIYIYIYIYILSCDIHTHTPAPQSSTNFLLYDFVINKGYTSCLGHGHESHSPLTAPRRGQDKRGRRRSAAIPHSHSQLSWEGRHFCFGLVRTLAGYRPKAINMSELRVEFGTCDFELV